MKNMRNAKKINQENKLQEFMFRLPTVELATLLDKGALITVIGEDERLYYMRYEKEIDDYLITSEISKNEIVNAIVNMVHSSYETAIKIAEESARDNLLKIINDLQKLTPPWNT